MKNINLIKCKVCKKSIIRKVWETKDKQKRITIPKDSDIIKGDYVIIKKIKVNGK